MFMPGEGLNSEKENKVKYCIFANCKRFAKEKSSIFKQAGRLEKADETVLYVKILVSSSGSTRIIKQPL